MAKYAQRSLLREKRVYAIALHRRQKDHAEEVDWDCILTEMTRRKWLKRALKNICDVNQRLHSLALVSKLILPL